MSSADIVVHGENANKHLSGIGGLVGFGYGIIEDSFSKGEVYGINNVGGLIGIGEWGVEIINSYSEAIVTGENNIGGLVGLGGIIKNSYATGTVTGNSFVGGLVGFLSAAHQISESFATGDVTGESYVGGLAGYQLVDKYAVKINNSYASGDVVGNWVVGGLVGEIDLGEIDPRGKYIFEPVSESFATGKVTSQEKPYGGVFAHVGVFVHIGEGDYSVEFSFPHTYWDMEGTGVDVFSTRTYEHDHTMSITGLRGLTTGQMTGQNAFIHMYKLDFENTWQLTSEGYPVHRWLGVADTVAPPEVPLIDDLPENHDFGSVAPDSMITQLFTIHNIGLAPLEGEAVLSGAGSEGFELLSGGGAFKLDPGDRQDVEVRFQPDRQGSFEAALQVIHNGANLDDTLKVILEGTGKTETSAGPPEKDRPVAFELHQNYPNPFNPVTHIPFTLPENSQVRLEVYDILGRRVAVLADRMYEAGRHEVVWDASRMSSGIYQIRMVVDPEWGVSLSGITNAGKQLFNRSVTLVK